MADRPPPPNPNRPPRRVRPTGLPIHPPPRPVSSRTHTTVLPMRFMRNVPMPNQRLISGRTIQLTICLALLALVYLVAHIVDIMCRHTEKIALVLSQKNAHTEQ